MISLEIQRRQIMLPAHLQGLITGASERRVLRRELDKRLLPQRNYSQTLSIKISEPTLKHMVSKYSEQLVFQPVNEIRHWFTYQSGAYIEPGYPPLYYGRERNKALSPNKSAVAAVGEAIAGFLSQRLYRCRKLARPNHDCPDIVMEANGVTFLVESKATLKTEELIRTTNVPFLCCPRRFYAASWASFVVLACRATSKAVTALRPRSLRT